MTIVMTKAELLEVLKPLLEKATAEDARRLEQHRKDEVATLERFHIKCREAARWDWKTLKRNGFEVTGGRYSFERPSCPTAEAPNIQRAIKNLLLDKRDREYKYNVATTENCDLYKALVWEPESKRAKKTMCD